MGLMLFWVFKLQIHNCVESWYSLHRLTVEQKTELCLQQASVNRRKYESK